MTETQPEEVQPDPFPAVPDQPRTPPGPGSEDLPEEIEARRKAKKS